MPTIHFLDVTNRDGVQTAPTGLSKFGKTMVNFYLAGLGVAQSLPQRPWHGRGQLGIRLYDDDEALGPFPADWHARSGRTVLTGEYGGMAGFRHVMDGLGIEIGTGREDVVFRLVQLLRVGDRHVTHRRRAPADRRLPGRAVLALPGPDGLTTRRISDRSGPGRASAGSGTAATSRAYATR